MGKVSGKIPLLTRKPDWEIALLSTIERYESLPFKTGSNDCFFMVMNCINAMTGYFPYKLYENKNKKKILNIIKQEGFNNLEEVFDYNFKKIDVENVQNGDIALIKSNPFDETGIVYNNIAYFKEIYSFARKPFTDVDFFYRVIV